MPNIRMLLWGALAAILLYSYQIWMHDYPAPGMPGSATQSAPAPGGNLGESLPQAASSAASADTRSTPLPRRPQPRPRLHRR